MQGPFNNSPPQKFIYPAKNTLSPNSSSSSNQTKKTPKKGKRSPSHSWTKEEEEIGNKLFKIINSEYPQRATKIVGMLLTANKTEDIKFMMERPHILMALASNYDQQQRIKEINKKK